MFRLARLRDTVHIQPSEFARPGDDEARSLLCTITDALNEKYPNRVVLAVGLCVALHDILQVGEARLFQGSAAQHTSVTFRVFVFRPFVGQVLLGRVASAEPRGVRVSMGFFDEIFVPAVLLQKHSRWCDIEKTWIWEVEGNADHTLYIETGSMVRFRVTEVTYPQPPGPQRAAGWGGSGRGGGGRGGGGGGGGLVAPEQAAAGAVAMRIVATMQEQGLGLVEWWGDGEGEDEGDGEAPMAEKAAHENGVA